MGRYTGAATGWISKRRLTAASHHTSANHHLFAAVKTVVFAKRGPQRLRYPAPCVLAICDNLP